MALRACAPPASLRPYRLHAVSASPKNTSSGDILWTASGGFQRFGNRCRAGTSAPVVEASSIIRRRCFIGDSMRDPFIMRSLPLEDQRDLSARGPGAGVAGPHGVVEGAKLEVDRQLAEQLDYLAAAERHGPGVVPGGGPVGDELGGGETGRDAGDTKRVVAVIPSASPTLQPGR